MSIELFWSGSQYLTNPRTDTGKFASARTKPLYYLNECLRLRSFEVLVRETDPRYMRRKHEVRSAIKYMKRKTQTQPDYRLYRSLRTLQGLDHVYALRGLAHAAFFDYSLFEEKKTKALNPGDVRVRKEVIRDEDFTEDVLRRVTRVKDAGIRHLSLLKNLAPLLETSEDQELEGEDLTALEKHYEVDWSTSVRDTSRQVAGAMPTNNSNNNNNGANNGDRSHSGEDDDGGDANLSHQRLQTLNTNQSGHTGGRKRHNNIDSTEGISSNAAGGSNTNTNTSTQRPNVLSTQTNFRRPSVVSQPRARMTSTSSGTGAAAQFSPRSTTATRQRPLSKDVITSTLSRGRTRTPFAASSNDGGLFVSDPNHFRVDSPALQGGSPSSPRVWRDSTVDSDQVARSDRSRSASLGFSSFDSPPTLRVVQTPPRAGGRISGLVQGWVPPRIDEEEESAPSSPVNGLENDVAETSPGADSDCMVIGFKKIERADSPAIETDNDTPDNDTKSDNDTKPDAQMGVSDDGNEEMPDAQISDSDGDGCSEKSDDSIEEIPDSDDEDDDDMDTDGDTLMDW